VSSNGSAVRALRWVPLAAAAYTAATLVRYYLAAPSPRFPVESAFFIFIGLGVMTVLFRRGGGEDAEGPAAARVGADDELKLAANLTLLAVAFVAAAFIVYAPAISVGLLSDDFVIARWAERFEFVHLEATGFVRPGVPAFWAMLRVLPGDFAVAAHATNIVLHGVNAALVTVIAFRLGLRRAEAVAAGVMFVLFPGLSEAIVWLSGVQDVLMTTLALTAVALSVAAEPRIVGAVAASAAALLVKETAVVIPVLSGLVIFGRNGLRVSRRQRRVLAALAIVTAIYVVARATAGVPSSFLAVNDWQYFTKQLMASSFAALGAPWTEDWGRTHAGLALLRAFAILAVAAAAFFSWRRGDPTFRTATACAGWVLAAVLPVFSLFYIGPQLEGARYLYLPAAGFVILLALLIGRVLDRVGPRWRVGGVGLLTAALAVPFLPAIRSDIGRWQTAAATRDDVLQRVADQADRWACTTFTAEGEADSVSGAYVFRHGLAEALDRPHGDSEVRCRVVMRPGEFGMTREP
jgi:hypothetical protein